jgi:hypothetical protein
MSVSHSHPSPKKPGGFWLKVAVVSLWGALSVEKSGLSLDNEYKATFPEAVFKTFVAVAKLCSFNDESLGSNAENYYVMNTS